jgi:hypothetical protein
VKLGLGRLGARAGGMQHPLIFLVLAVALILTGGQEPTRVLSSSSLAVEQTVESSDLFPQPTSTVETIE